MPDITISTLLLLKLSQNAVIELGPRIDQIDKNREKISSPCCVLIPNPPVLSDSFGSEISVWF